jgi:hypothetical protein
MTSAEHSERAGAVPSATDDSESVAEARGDDLSPTEHFLATANDEDEALHRARREWAARRATDQARQRPTPTEDAPRPRAFVRSIVVLSSLLFAISLISAWTVEGYLAELGSLLVASVFLILAVTGFISLLVARG